MSQNSVQGSLRRAGFLGAIALSGAALVLAPAALARDGSRGGGGSHGGGGSVSHSGGGRVSSGAHFSPSSRGGSRGTTNIGPRSTGGWRTVSGHPGGHWGGSRWGTRPGWGYRPYSYWGWNWGWGWNSWGWDWGWGWAPYWSTWWWGGPSMSFYVAPEIGGDADTGDVAPRRGRYAVVKTDVTPDEAQVYLDGKYIGSADDFDGFPGFLYLGPGTYHLEFRLPNYQTYAVDLEVSRGQQVRVKQELKLESGKSALDAFPPESKGTPLGRVFTKSGGTAEAAPRGDDGWSDRGAVPRRDDAWRSREAAPRGDVRDDGWSDRDAAPAAPAAPERAEGERTEGERTEMRAAPAPRPSNRGRLKIRVTPDDAAVYMDDKYLGAADDLAANPRGIVAEPGAHSITVTRPGYKTKTVEVTARAGSPVDVVVELEK